MPSNYTVIQYVPDPILGERINVGVAGYFAGQVQTRFLVNWDRVKLLCGKGSLTLDGLEAIFRGIDQDRLLNMMETWKNSIQFTEPGASMYPVSHALDVAVKRYLVDFPPAASATRSREDVFCFARDTLRASVNQAMGRTMGKSLVRAHMTVQGRSGQTREYDLGVRRDKPMQVFQALSFAGSRGTERIIQSAAFLADEVKGVLPMTVVFAPPPEETPEFIRASRTFEYFGAEFVAEKDFPDVAKRVTQELAA